MTAKEILRTRRQLGLNQVEFARLTGVHPITISKWERSKSVPSPYQSSLLKEFAASACNVKQDLADGGVIRALKRLLT